MKKSVPTIPTKPVDEANILPLRGMEPPYFFLRVDWLALACMRKPFIKFTFDKSSSEDWLLYDQIDILAENMDVYFTDAAHWALRQALGENFQSARDMYAGVTPWDLDIQYVCRIFSLQLCKSHRMKGAYNPERLDQVIEELLVTDEELLRAATPGNSLSC